MEQPVNDSDNSAENVLKESKVSPVVKASVKRKEGNTRHYLQYNVDDTPSIKQYQISVKRKEGSTRHYLQYNVDNIPSLKRYQTYLQSLVGGKKPPGEARQLVCSRSEQILTLCHFWM